ncbi:hypothetical protein CWI39_0551p0020 [Hamiltosporidium magnivora]|uniref:Uncharacterized protein n=1 Tax=Hamiltosporidium magnivora TaxID=148818 RepID=A0A4V2JW11_9MICR|nr:hypothetical protein CWI39_0551p0020 [Hamiltosporidium magnivora]
MFRMECLLCFLFYITYICCNKNAGAYQRSNLRANSEDSPNGRSQMFGDLNGLGPTPLGRPYGSLGTGSGYPYSRNGPGTFLP